MEIAMLTAATRGLNSSIYPGDECCAFYKDTDFYNKDDSARLVKCRVHNTHWFDLNFFLQEETRTSTTTIVEEEEECFSAFGYGDCRPVYKERESEIQIDILPLSSFICGKNI